MIAIKCDREDCPNKVYISTKELMGTYWLDCCFYNSFHDIAKKQGYLLVELDKAKREYLLLCKECYEKVQQIKDNALINAEDNIKDKINVMLTKTEDFKEVEK